MCIRYYLGLGFVLEQQRKSCLLAEHWDSVISPRLEHSKLVGSWRSEFFWFSVWLLVFGIYWLIFSTILVTVLNVAVISIPTLTESFHFLKPHFFVIVSSTLVCFKLWWFVLTVKNLGNCAEYPTAVCHLPARVKWPILLLYKIHLLHMTKGKHKWIFLCL